MEKYQKFTRLDLEQRLRLLHKERPLAFAASCCARNIHHYQPFQQEEGWGDETPLFETLYYLWELLAKTSSFSLEKISTLQERCERIIPHSEDFSSLHTPYALNAALALYYVLEYLQKRELQALVYCAEQAINSIDLYLKRGCRIDSNTPEGKVQILEHPLMQQELRLQDQALMELAQEPVLPFGSTNFVQHWRYPDKTILDMSLQWSKNEERK